MLRTNFTQPYNAEPKSSPIRTNYDEESSIEGGAPALKVARMLPRRPV